jgi:multiple sugar transport system ATP-binding protein
MAEIELRHVTKRFGDTTAVNDASLIIRDKEFFVLVGPSGCGKSTLLNVIVGLEEATEGDILVDGRRVNDVDPKDRNMAMVFQSYALYPHMTVRENIAFPLKLAGRPRADVEARVQQAARILELSDLLDRKPGALSGGQRQRVAMGRAIPTRSCSTSRSPTSTPSSARRCAPRSRACSAGSAPPRSTSLTIKQRP